MNAKMKNQNVSLDQQPNGFLLLFRGKDWDNALTDDELPEAMGQMMAWFDALQSQGKVKGGQPLQRVGKVISAKGVSDGPFAESKEEIGGYLLLDVPTMEEAVKIAEAYPGFRYGITVEVRPTLVECPCFARANKRLAMAVH
jgi:hypothetical protein